MARTLLYEAQKSIFPYMHSVGLIIFFNLHSAKLFAGQNINIGLSYSQILRHLQQTDIPKSQAWCCH